MEHLDHPGRALSEWARVLNPKGEIVISTPNGATVSAVGGNPEHKAIYAPEDVIGALQKRGLTIIASRGIYTGLVSGNRLFRLIPFVWVKKWLLRIPVPLSLSYDVFLLARKETRK